jgi:hypothetical protein
MRACIMLVCIVSLGCASVRPPENRAEFERAIGQSCEAAVTVCNVYEALPADVRNARDDATCRDARKWCAVPVQIPAVP